MMRDFGHLLGPRFVDFHSAALRAAKAVTSLVLTDARDYEPSHLAMRMMDTPIASSENCTPVIPTNELLRIRDEARRRADSLAQRVAGIGAGLDSSAVVNAYLHFWSHLEGRKWCIYKKDKHIMDDINDQADRANRLIREAGNKFYSNFHPRWSEMRSRFQPIVNAANTVDIDIRPLLDAYKAFWAKNFGFSLHRSLDGRLDSELSEYATLTPKSETEFNRGNNRVQHNFDAQYGALDSAQRSLTADVALWRDIDGNNGYSSFDKHWDDFVRAWNKWSQFVVLKTPGNDKKFATSGKWADQASKQRKIFPGPFPAFSSSDGMEKGGGIPDERFYAHNSMNALLSRLGKRYRKIAKDEKGYEYRNLFVTALSYERGGALPYGGGKKVHKEHKEGLDADVWGIRLDQRKKNDFDTKKTQSIIEAALAAGATRVIYTHQQIVDAANKTAKKNGWKGRAANLAGHKDHIHVDV